MGSKTISRRRKIQRRVRKKIKGTATRPRLSVFRSNKGVYAQVIDDNAGSTLAAASYKEVQGATRMEVATALGRLIGERAIAAGINNVVFDRSGYLYHGRIKALADGARGEKKEDGTNELLQF